MTFFHLLEMCIGITNYTFVGHLSDNYVMAALGLGTMLINVGFISTFLGLNKGLETLIA